jgi:hypothetical protein
LSNQERSRQSSLSDKNPLFAFIIITAYTSWWVVIIGLGGIVVGLLIMCLYVVIEEGDIAWLGPIVMSFFGLITGGAMLGVWGMGKVAL